MIYLILSDFADDTTEIVAVLTHRPGFEIEKMAKVWYAGRVLTKLPVRPQWKPNSVEGIRQLAMEELCWRESLAAQEKLVMTEFDEDTMMKAFVQYLIRYCGFIRLETISAYPGFK